jgi:nucleotide-binding universal stress UspA family protein
MGEVNCDIVVLRAPKDWQLSQVRRILVPTGGRGGHDRLLARLLGSLSRSEHKEITFLKVLHEQATSHERDSARQEITAMAAVQCAGSFEVQIACSDHPIRTVAEYAAHSDLAILGVQHVSRRQKLFGQFALQVALRTPQPLLLISGRG